MDFEILNILNCNSITYMSPGTHLSDEPLFCLVGSTAFVQEPVQPIKDGVVEEFIFPEKKFNSTNKVHKAQELEQTAVSIPAEHESNETQVVSQESSLSEGGVKEEMASQFDPIENSTEPSSCMVEDVLEEECSSDFCFDHDPYCDPEKKWYFVLKPGYYYFSDNQMRKFFDDGGFTIRGEAGCKVWGPLLVWVDGGYFQKSGKAFRSSDEFGGSDDIEFKLATITLGLKCIYFYNSCVGFYAGAGPRLFMMMMENNGSSDKCVPGLV